MNEEKKEEVRVEVSSEPCKPTTSFAPTHFVRRENQHSGDVRNRVLPVRFTPGEYEDLRKNSSATNLSLSEYVRRAVLNRKLPTQTAPEINRALYEELGRIGNNLNQLMKAIHSGKVTFINPDALELLQAAIRTLGIQILRGYPR